MAVAESLELVRIKDTQNAVQIFTGGGMAAILDRIEEEVRARSQELDVSTSSGRDAIRSLAHQIARTKVALNEEGKRLTEEWRKNTALVNEERKKSDARLDDLRDEVRKPLTDFENKEKARVGAHEAAIADLGGLITALQAGRNLANATASQLAEHLLDYQELHKDRDWEEFADRARKVRHEASVLLIGKIESRKAWEAEQAELSRLRAKEAARLQKERDERLQAEAAETARKKAEAEAQAKADAEAARVAEQQAAAERERQRIQREKDEAEARARKAEEDRLEAIAAANRERIVADERAAEAARQMELAIREADRKRAEAEQKAERDRQEAAAQAQRDAEAAAKQERDQIAAEQAQAESERIAREQDLANQARIWDEIKSDLAAYVPKSKLSPLCEAIMNGTIRNLKVIY